MSNAARPNTLVRITALACLSLLIACSDDSPTKSTPPPPPPETQQVPNFSIQDVNPNSARSGEMVSPRDYLGSVSAWYFGHAT